MRLPRPRWPALPALPVDAYDLAGLAGMALVCAGVRALWGWPWAAIVLGAALLAVFVIHERALVAAARRNG